jgi:cytochrome c oxidase cbb3-type subunit 3
MSRLPRRFVVLGVSLLAAVMLQACEPRSQAPALAGPAPLPAIRYEANVSAGGRAPPGGILRNPYSGNAGIAKNGAQLFSAMNCDGCHGAGAAGWVGPNLADGRWRYGGADEEIFNSIYYGRPRGMPAFGGALGTEGAWILVTYLKSLPVPKDIGTESWDSL